MKVLQFLELSLPTRPHQQCPLCSSAANRDEDVFRNPDKFDIRRPEVGEQVAYGAGIHRW